MFIGDSAKRPKALNRIRDLNDAFRRTGEGGTRYFSDEIKACGLRFLTIATNAIARFDAFTECDDPDGEHRAGRVLLEGRTLFFQINYFYDRETEQTSTDAADPAAKRTLFVSLKPIPFV